MEDTGNVGDKTWGNLMLWMFTLLCLKKISMLSSKNKRGKLYLIKESVKHTDKLLSKH